MARLFHSCFNLGNFLSLTIRRPSCFGAPPAVASEDDPWKEIPGDLMDLIAATVGLSDRHSMGAVCKSWGSMKKECLSCVNELPWFVLPHDPHCEEFRCLNLSQGTMERIRLPKPLRGAEFIGSSNGWLAFIKIDAYGMRLFSKEPLLFLFNPVSRQLLRLPSISKTPCYRNWVSKKKMQPRYIFNIAISSNQIKESTMVAAIFCYGYELAICKPGDEQWTIFTGTHELEEYGDMMEKLAKDEHDTCQYTDILFRNDTLFVVSEVQPHEVRRSSHPDHSGIYFLESLKLHFINVYMPGQIVRDLSACCSEWLVILNNHGSANVVEYTYLTSSVQHELLLVVRWAVVEDGDSDDDDLPIPSDESTKRFEIFRLDVRGGGIQISPLKNIGDQALFLGRNGTKVVDSKEFSGIQGNCVFFLAKWPEEKHEGEDHFYISRDSGECNLADQKVVRSLPTAVERFEFRIDWFSPAH